MATKINKLLQAIPQNALLFSSWMSEKDIDTKEQSCYVKSGWIERIAHGVYKVAGSKPTLYSALHSYSSQLSKDYNIGAVTALDLRGFSHYGIIGKPKAFLFTTKNSRFPSWLLSHSWDMDIRYTITSILADSTLGVEEMNQGSFTIKVSSPERAFIECLLLAPTDISYIDTYYIMEMLTTLRPKLVQSLLEQCNSIKVKRMFLYMAEKAGHQWFQSLKLDRINIGSGSRSLSKNGRYISKYNIIVPTELADYE